MPEVILQADNRRVRILGAPTELLKGLDRVTSYPVAGHRFTRAFKARRWDGREHLMTYRAKPPSGYFVPFGLLADAIAYFQKKKIDVKLDFEERRKPGAPVDFGWDPDCELRPYQVRVLEVITKEGWRRGTGILKMPIRSGKTKTTAAIIRALRARTLFIVSSAFGTLSLLEQTREALKETLQTRMVGKIGEGEWDERDITVASIQTLTKCRGKIDPKTKKRGPMDPRYLAMLQAYDLVVWDECHHLRGKEWRGVMLDFDAPFKLGLSATVYLSDKKENERGAIWLKACCGNIRVDISTSELIDDGFLVRPDIHLVRIRQPEGLKSLPWGEELVLRGVYANPHRNAIIARIAGDHIIQGRKVLVVSDRLEQVADLAARIRAEGYQTGEVIGSVPTEERTKLIRRFQSGKIHALVGTVFGEGIDIPEIEVVINAEGGKDIKATIQRMRNLTVSDGKDQAIVVDFIDETNPYLTDHSLARIRTYRTERAFQIHFEA